MTGCIFCDMAEGRMKTPVLFQDDRCFVIRDINPMAPTHILVIPNRHMTSLAQLGPQEESLVGHLITVAEAVARREGVDRSGFRLAINQGTDAGQGIAHLHLHLLGGKSLPKLG